MTFGLHLFNSTLLKTILWAIVFNLFYNSSSFTSSYYEIHKWGEFAPTVANLYFYWLDLTFLPALLLTLLYLIYLTGSFLRYSTSIITLSVILLTFFTNSTDFLFSNNLVALTSPHYHNVNSFLLNSLNKYHPLIFYLSALLIFIFLNINPRKTSNCFYEVNSLHVLLQKRVVILMLNGFSLFLGSWWALQEWTWGGWWNWDPSETFGLGVALFVLLHLHSSTTYKDYSNYKKKSILLLILFVGTYFLVQLNFEILSHNFGLDSFLFFNKNSHLLYVGFGLVLMYQKFKKDALVSQPKSSFLTKEIVPSASVLSFVWLSILLSYWPIVTFLLWKFTSFNWATTISIPSALFLIILYLLRESIFKSFGVSSVQLNPISLVTLHPVNHIYLQVTQKNASFSYTFTHVWFILLILFSITSYQQDFFSWASQKNSYQILVGNSYLRTPETLWNFQPHVIESFTMWRSSGHITTFQQLEAVSFKPNLIDFSPLINANGNFYNFHPHQSSRYSTGLNTQVHNLHTLGFYTALTASVFLYVLRRRSTSLNYTNF